MKKIPEELTEEDQRAIRNACVPDAFLEALKTIAQWDTEEFETAVCGVILAQDGEAHEDDLAIVIQRMNRVLGEVTLLSWFLTGVVHLTVEKQEVMITLVDPSSSLDSLVEHGFAKKVTGKDA